LHPGGKLLAANLSAEGKVRVVDWTGEREELLVEADPDLVADMAFSPDGSLLATAGRSGRFRLWDPLTGAERRRLQEAGPAVSRIAFSPDSRSLAALDAEGRLTLHDLVGNGERWTARPGQGHGKCLVFTPDGGTLICATADDRLSLIESAGGREVWSIRVVGGIGQALFRTGPSGRRELFTVTDDGLVQERDLQTGRVLRPLTVGNGFTSDTNLTPDGRFLVTIGFNGIPTMWELDRPRFAHSPDRGGEGAGNEGGR
jgi:WD40 repeat protein